MGWTSSLIFECNRTPCKGRWFGDVKIWDITDSSDPMCLMAGVAVPLLEQRLPQNRQIVTHDQALLLMHSHCCNWLACCPLITARLIKTSMLEILLSMSIPLTASHYATSPKSQKKIQNCWWVDATYHLVPPPSPKYSKNQPISPK